MAIYRKETVDRYLQELETYHLALRRAVEGSPPSTDDAYQYQFEPTPERFVKEFVNIDLERVLYQVEHFRVAVQNLKNLKNKAVKPTHR